MTDLTTYPQLKQLFDAVCDLALDEQAKAVQALQASPAVKAALLHLLANDRGEALTPPAPMLEFDAAMPHADLEAALPIAVGDTLGPWRIRSKLGQGGMGDVYCADRCDGQFAQMVAIKVLRGVCNAGSSPQLAVERRALATLAHPNIARLLDAGTTPSGQPYLVMDHVDGVDIDTHCWEKRLNWRGVLGLVQTLCMAFNESHQRLFIHCDIKPGNVLVTAEGRPMVLDFGVAQVLDAAHSGASRNPSWGFTPRYASPEQAGGLALTTATDVYSLGKLLGRLLRHEPAPNLVAKELQAVVAQATRTDPAQRYASMTALHDDLGRVLNQRPVAAMGAGGLVRRTQVCAAQFGGRGHRKLGCCVAHGGISRGGATGQAGGCCRATSTHASRTCKPGA